MHETRLLQNRVKINAIAVRSRDSFTKQDFGRSIHRYRYRKKQRIELFLGKISCFIDQVEAKIVVTLIRVRRKKISHTVQFEAVK